MDLTTVVRNLKYGNRRIQKYEFCTDTQHCLEFLGHTFNLVTEEITTFQDHFSYLCHLFWCDLLTVGWVKASEMGGSCRPLKHLV